MSKAKPYLIVLILFLLCFSLRLSLISKGPYHIDTLGLLIESQRILDTEKLSYDFGPGYILSTLLGVVSIWLGRFFSIKDPVLAVNFISVLFSSLNILILYLIVKKLFNSTAALLSALLLNFTPVYLGLSIYEKSHMPAVFFLLMSVLCIVNFFRQDQWKYILWAGCFFGCMGATRPSDMVLLFPAISFLLLAGICPSSHRCKAIQTYGIFLMSTAVTLLLFFLPLTIVKDKEAVNTSASFFWSSGVVHNFRGLFSPSLLISLEHLLDNLLPIGFVWVLLGTGELWKNFPRILTFLLIWFLLPLGFYGNLYSTVPRFLMISLIPLIVIEGYLLSKLLKKSISLRFCTLSTFLITLCLFFNGIFPILLFRHHNALLPDFARWVAQHTEGSSKIIAIDHGLFLRYYGNRQEFGRPLAWGKLLIDATALAEFQKQLDKELSQGIPIYITSTGLYAYDTAGQFVDFMRNNYRLRFIGRHLTEDWHQGETEFRVGWEALFKVEEKI